MVSLDRIFDPRRDKSCALEKEPVEESTGNQIVDLGIAENEDEHDDEDEDEDDYLSADDIDVMENYVQICPHEKLTFRRLQAIRNSRGFKESFQGVCAITEGSDPHHVVTGAGTASWQDKPSYIYRKNGSGRSWCSTECSLQECYVVNYMGGHYKGVRLRSEWIFWLDDAFPDGIHSPADMQQLLKDLHPQLWLCPHMTLDNCVTSEVLFQALKVGKHGDPTMSAKVKETFIRQGDCSFCYTEFCHNICCAKNYFRVRSFRFLGKAKSSKDPVWLSQ
ncbi:MAG: hypothetical protein Q9218_000054 [Villophora microphyllina]